MEWFASGMMDIYRRHGGIIGGGHIGYWGGKGLAEGHIDAMGCDGIRYIPTDKLEFVYKMSEKNISYTCI